MAQTASGGKMSLKTFDCQKMPAGLRKRLFEIMKKSNDVYVDWWINATNDPLPGMRDIDAWLISQGARAPKTPDHEGEHVLIKYWW